MADEKGIWTPANIVTCVRIAFIPVFMVVGSLAWGEGGVVSPVLMGLAFVIYVTLSLTDKVDSPQLTQAFLLNLEMCEAPEFCSKNENGSS